MLKSLYIRNYVLIDSLDIRFNESFTVITGETGAGKSIILGALGLVLGQRADTKSIKSGTDKCVIEAVFDISEYDLEPFFKEHEMEYDSGSCILRRELFSSGKSRSFVNDSPASLNAVKDLGNRLIDIHSQHQNLLLADNKFQLKVVDAMAGNASLLQHYRQGFTHYQSLKKGLKSLKDKAAQAKQDEDYIRFQLEQLDNAKLTEGEQTGLEAELETLSHAEDIKSSFYRITNLLNEDGQGCVQMLKEALTTAEALNRYYPKAKDIIERIRTAYIDLNDLASETDSLKEDIDFNPERLQYVNDRLNELYSLEQKHRAQSVEELLSIRDNYTKQLTEIESFDEQIGQLEKETDASYKDLLKQASTLSDRRRKASEAITPELVTKLSMLGMPNTRFKIDIVPKAEPDADGMDDIRFLFSANKSGELERVAQTASGGEISRLMLCIKAMIAGYTALPAIIFDEVDMGVSGDIADKMGTIMEELGDKMQVIAITHLPQIASKGKEHYYVYKEDTPDATVTQIKKLDKDDRIREVARMLSGASLTEASIANAKELLQL